MKTKSQFIFKDVTIINLWILPILMFNGIYRLLKLYLNLGKHGLDFQNQTKALPLRVGLPIDFVIQLFKVFFNELRLFLYTYFK